MTDDAASLFQEIAVGAFNLRRQKQKRRQTSASTSSASDSDIDSRRQKQKQKRHQTSASPSSASDSDSVRDFSSEIAVAQEETGTNPSGEGQARGAASVPHEIAIVNFMSAGQLCDLRTRPVHHISYTTRP